ncbi:MAG: tetratricopeptide repeat protein [Methylococcaceae bacterium]
MKQLVCLVSVVALWLAGCSMSGVKSTDGTVAVEDVHNISTLKPTAQKEPQVVYLLLAAELAGQRGQYEEALKNYMEVTRLAPDAHVAERATQVAIFLKDNEQALEAARTWGQVDPANPSPHRIQAMLLLKRGQTSEAMDQFKTMLNQQDAELEHTLIELVKWLNTEVDRQDGLDLMNQLVSQYPKIAELHFAYALLASERGEHRLALNETEKALAMHPDMNRARLLRAQVMAQMGDSAAARAAVKQALGKDPQNASLRIIYAQFLVKAGERRAAHRELDKVLKHDPDNHDARFGIATLLMEEGQLRQAAGEFRSLTGVEKWQYQANFYLGLIEARQGHLEVALTYFDRVDNSPMEFDAKVNATTALINLGRMAEARQRLASTRSKFPNEALRLYLLESELLVRNKEYSEAFDLLTGALTEMPGQVELLYSRALVAEQLERIDVMETDLRVVLEKNPDDANALNALGYTLTDRDERLDEARPLLERAMLLRPHDPAILDSYGWLLYRQGDLHGALDYLKQAYGLVKDPEIGGHLGELLWQLGQRNQARQIWREMIRKDPGHVRLNRLREKYPEGFR